VKITDFGIAKSALSTAMTETGVTFGTADYISPEQAQGQPATARSDVYALGVTLYEMLTGRLPFMGESSVAVAMQHVSAEPPPPRMFNPRITPQLEALVLRALAKRPEDRPPSARELARLLRSYHQLGEQDTVVRPLPAPAPRPPQRPSPATGATGAVPRNPLPAPRSAVAAPAPDRGGSGVGAFLLGLMLMGVILAAVYVVATVPLGDLFGTAAGRPRPGDQATATVETPTPEPTPELITVPDVTGLEERLAIAALEAAGLRPRAELPRYTDTPTDTLTTPGLVFDQLPRGGEQVTGTTTVTYVVSLGPSLIDVPNVVTMRGADAEFQLTTLGLAVERLEAPDRLSAGFVFRMEPQAGVRLRRGDTVTIYVSIGDKVVMPRVVGLAEQEARAAIERAGLFVSFADQQGCDRLPQDICDRYPPGVVVSATVPEGELVDRGTGVTLGVRAP
jgi:serine/threonine-protein kinase